MRRTLTVLALAVALFSISAATAVAATSTYRGPMYWSSWWDGSSSYSQVWKENWFLKSTTGVSDTMITFIDNGVYGYSWHGTLRSTASIQHIYADATISTPYTKKGYCKFYSGTPFNGSCVVNGV